MEFSINEFKKFLIEAKKATYPTQGDAASVVPYFKGSKQLEYKKENFVYRDVYYGTTFFTGQEVVEYKEKLIWSMVYSGGIINTELSREEMFVSYHFLRRALIQVDLNEFPNFSNESIN